MRNSALSLATTTISKAINTLAFILIARSLGTDPSGVFSLGTTYLAVFTAFNWGVDELMIRQVARDRSQAGQYFGTALTASFALTGIAYGLYFLLVDRLMPYAPSTSLPLLVMGLSFIPDSLGNVAQSLLAAHERFDVPLYAGLLSSLIKTGGTLWALYGGATLGKLLLGPNQTFISPVLVQIGLFWFIGACLGAVVSLVAAGHLVGRLHLDMWLDRTFWIENSRMALPFMAMGFLITLEFQTDVIIISAVRDEHEVGLYGAVTTIIFALMMLSQAFRAAVYPLMARYQKNKPGQLGRIYDLSMFYLGALALPMAAGLTLLAPKLIILLYKSAFTGAILPLQIAVWLLLFNFLNVPNSRLMLVSDRQNVLTWILVGSMGINILLNLLLDPSLGAVGASIARVSSSMVFFLVNFSFVQRNLHRFHLFSGLAQPLAATAFMTIAVWLVGNLPLPVSIELWLALVVGVIIYLASLVTMRGISPEERQWLNSLIQWARARV